MQFDFSEEERDAFFERHFEYDEDDATNLEKAKAFYEKSLLEVQRLDEMLKDGEVFDEVSAVLWLSNLILSREFINKFEKEVGLV